MSDASTYELVLVEELSERSAEQARMITAQEERIAEL